MPIRYRQQHKRRGQTAKAHSSPGLLAVIHETVLIWRRHHLTYDQTKYVVEQVRHQLDLEAPARRRRTVQRLDRAEVERLVNCAYQDRSREGLLIKTLFLTGARVSEFVYIRIEDLFLDDDPPQIHITHAKGHADRYVPVLPALAQEWRTHLENRRRGWLFESNRHQRYAVRSVQAMVRRCALRAGIGKHVYPHLLRHSIATILLDSGQVPIDQVQKFLGHLHLSTTQIYAETSLRALGENYIRALTGAGPR
jgi:integrase/recombinase XerD